MSMTKEPKALFRYNDNEKILFSCILISVLWLWVFIGQSVGCMRIMIDTAVII